MYFNAAYTQLETYTEVMVRAAVVKTLLQIPGVDSITFYVAGNPPSGQHRSAGGRHGQQQFHRRFRAGERVSFDHDFDALLRERGRTVSDPGTAGGALQQQHASGAAGSGISDAETGDGGSTECVSIRDKADQCVGVRRRLLCQSG